jgi:hypothetical protein
MASSLECGVRLVRQAVLQDSKQNYEEASRCYKEAIRTFNEYGKTSNQGPDLLALLAARIKEYENRVRVIDSYLLERTDVKKLLRELDVSNEDWCGSSSTSSNSTTTRQLYKNPQLVEPLDCLRRGRRADEAGDYKAALAFYEYGVSQLFSVLNAGTLTQRQEERARERCLFYHERAQIIRQRLDDGKRIRGGHVCVSSLSLDSEGEGKDSNPETEKLLEMSEVQSCCSNLGSRQTLNQSFEERDSGSGHHSSSDHPHYAAVTSGHSDRYNSLDMDQSFEYKTLDRTHATLTGTLDRRQLNEAAVLNQGELMKGSVDHHTKPVAGLLDHRTTLHGSLPVLFTAGKPTEIQKSTHSLWTNMDLKRSCAILPGVHRNGVTRVPLADINQELCISAGSLNSETSSCSLGKDRSYTYLEVKLGRDTNDTIESELVNLSASCGNLKDEDTGSDSGYSDPSPDVISGAEEDGHGIINDDSVSDSRKSSPFSDYGVGVDEFDRTGLARPLLMDSNYNTGIFPRVIIQSDGRQLSHDPFGRRLDPNDPDYNPRHAHGMQRQRSIFQNPEKDILISQSSRDNLVVLSADSLDAATLAKEERKMSPRHAMGNGGGSSIGRPRVMDPRTRSDVRPEVYSKYLGRHDPIPCRALAHRQDNIKRDGCFYLAAALDFCWCL